MRRLALLGVLVLALTGCFHSDVQQAPPTVPTFRHYVALGDTFTAAPYTATTRQAHGCLRAEDNYPSLLATALKISDFTDVSCADAWTESVTKPQKIGKHTKIAPQLDAVHRNTDLVTIGLGINENGLYAGVMNACKPKGVGCYVSRAERVLDLSIGALRQSLDKVIRKVQQQAPDATVVLVGYPRHVAVDATCKAEPKKMTKLDRQAWSRVDQALDLAMSRAVRDTGIGYADVYAASKGHDFCSAEPWVRGRKTDKHHGLQLGPTKAEQQAVVGLVRGALTEDD